MKRLFFHLLESYDFLKSILYDAIVDLKMIFKFGLKRNFEILFVIRKFVIWPTIRAKSVGPLRRNYQWFSPLPIFNIDPYRTGTDSTIERNIETGVGRGNCIWIQGLGVTIPLENRQKINVSSVNGWMKLKRERRSNDFWPWLSERVSKYCI